MPNDGDRLLPHMQHQVRHPNHGRHPGRSPISNTDDDAASVVGWFGVKAFFLLGGEFLRLTLRNLSFDRRALYAFVAVAIHRRHAVDVMASRCDGHVTER